MFLNDKIKCILETIIARYYPFAYPISLYVLIKNFDVCIEMQIKECGYK